MLDVVRRVLGAARRLEDEALSPAIRFRGDELVLRINDRLNAPNTKESFAALEPAFREALGKIYAGTAFTVEQFGTPRELFSVRVKARAHRASVTCSAAFHSRPVGSPASRAQLTTSAARGTA